MGKAAMKDWLRIIPLFAELPDEELEMLASTSRSLSAKKNARLFDEGAPADCCYVLTLGNAKVVLSGSAGTEIVLGTVSPKSLVGEVALLDRASRSASLIATTPCHLIRIPIASFERLRSNAGFERKVVAHVVALLRAANDQVRGIAESSTMARVGWCLGRIARQEGRRDAGGVLIPRRKHQELAEMIGCSRETVSRKLETLRRRKCVSWDKTTMRLDIEALERCVRAEISAPERWA
jgi:CRP/FNR family cyclic AMP-dependent transcriptional regulator